MQIAGAHSQTSGGPSMKIFSSMALAAFAFLLFSIQSPNHAIALSSYTACQSRFSQCIATHLQDGGQAAVFACTNRYGLCLAQAGIALPFCDHLTTHLTNSFNNLCQFQYGTHGEQTLGGTVTSTNTALNECLSQVQASANEYQEKSCPVWERLFINSSVE